MDHFNPLTNRMKIQNVPTGIQGEKSRKDMANSGKQYFEHKQVPKRLDGTRCPEGYAFPAGMPHLLQMPHGNSA